MARKSRKQNNKVDVPNLKPSLIQTAAYVRLSVDDRKQKGTSIETQQRIIQNYIEENPEFELYDTYIDLGVSGTTFDRKDFQRMLRDAEARIINCIMLKDLSRLGRNAIETGYYIEKLFPKLGVRIISITDNYDSAIDTGRINVPLINLVNEVYSIDISQKTRSQKRQAMDDGVFVGGHPPYGYKRSSDDRRKLIADTPAAETVRQIFAWAADKVSIHEIVKRLNDSNIPSPRRYLSETSASNEHVSTSYALWQPRTVKNILANEIYLGRLIQGKTKRINFVRQPTPASEWISYNDAHEAIIQPELFETVQTIRNKTKGGIKKGARTAYSANIFKGKVYCAHCGGYLERRKNHDKYIFHCVTNRVASDSCVGNSIEESEVRLAIFKQLLKYKDYISDDTNIDTVESNVISELRFAEMELSHTQGIVRSLYENLVNQVLSKSEYRELKSSYQGKFETQRLHLDMLKQKLNDERRKKKALRESLQILNGLSETKELTKEHIDRFIERIEVFRDGKIFVEIKGFID